MAMPYCVVNAAPPSLAMARDSAISASLYGPDLVSVGQLQVSVNDIISLKPDVVTFSVTYRTKSRTSTQASNTNSITMQQFKRYLNELGIKENDLTTVSYRNYMADLEEGTEAGAGKRYETCLLMGLDINQPQFLKVVSLLERQQINALRQASEQNSYEFAIIETAATPQAAKDAANKKYHSLVPELIKLGINNLTIKNYVNSVTTNAQQTVNMYFVENALQIKLRNFDQIGKIIAKAQLLGMTMNDDLNYQVSEAARSKALQANESQILSKLENKASGLLSNNDYLLGAVTNLEFSENDVSTPPMPYYQSDNVFHSMPATKNVVISTPSTFKIRLSLTGSFDILKAMK